MKHILTMMALLFLAFLVQAQPQGRGPQGPDGPFGDGPQFGQMDPEKMAQEQTDRLDKLVQLTPKQYKKIYRFNKRQYKQLQREMEEGPGDLPGGFPQGRPEGMGPGGPGMGPGGPGMGPGGPGGRRPEGMGPGGPGRPDRPRFGGANAEKMQEIQEARVKKYRKVLTEEQFMKWESFEAEREFGRMRENPKAPNR